jgi:hypothetical protein
MGAALPSSSGADVTSVVYDRERERWVEDDSALSMFGDGEAEVFSGQWDRAGAVRGTQAGPRQPAHSTSSEDRLWPTPAASTPNDGEAPAQWLGRFIKHASAGPKATRAGVPLSVAARAPIILKVARVGTLVEARELLELHAREPVPELASEDPLNPAWVEMLMGFPVGWTDVGP